MKLNQSVSGKNVFIVDDVVTTGATITEAWKVVSLGGATVLSALVVSEARR
jgi:predicted amidophosphoribosyltransferase